MLDPNFQKSRARVVDDFRRARRQGFLEQIVSRLSGQSANLLSYEQIRKQLTSTARKPVVLREIPLDAIVGSVGRYTDFTRSFLPKDSVSQFRWSEVKLATLGTAGLPPIEVYQIGEVYFVLDGNHRVSVARQSGATLIEAYVTEFQTDLPLSPDDQPDDLILKAEYADFLKKTQIAELRPEADIRITAPGKSQLLEEHIEVHHYYMGLDQQRDISNAEAVTSWFDTVYMPVVNVIREKGLLRDFPDRTETDLYLWASKHREELIKELGWEVDSTRAAADLAAQANPKRGRGVSRVGERILDGVASDDQDNGAKPKDKPRERWKIPPQDHLFGEILVPVSGEKTSWDALGQAFEVARHEGSQLYGLHIISPDLEAESEHTQTLKGEFAGRCQTAGITGELVLATGKVSQEICNRAPWTDLIILKLEHPPPKEVLAKLSSGFRAIIRNCTGPVMAVPGEAAAIQHVLLAYDGSPKAEEALYIAAYLAGAWEIPLTVISVTEGDRISSKTLERAEAYLKPLGINATLVQGDGPVASEILVTAEERECDLIVMGGYQHNPIAEVVLGSAVNEVLRSSWIPVLICQ